MKRRMRRIPLVGPMEEGNWFFAGMTFNLREAGLGTVEVYAFLEGPHPILTSKIRYAVGDWIFDRRAFKKVFGLRKEPENEKELKEIARKKGMDADGIKRMGNGLFSYPIVWTMDVGNFGPQTWVWHGRKVKEVLESVK